MPNSLATCVSGRPPLANSATDPRVKGVDGQGFAEVEAYGQEH